MVKKGILQLILLMTLVAIACVLMTRKYIAEHSANARRHQATHALKHLAKRLREYYSLEGRYSTVSLLELQPEELYRSGHYQFRIEEISDDHFVLSAIPITEQAKSDKCGRLFIDELDHKNISGEASLEECWS